VSDHLIIIIDHFPTLEMFPKFLSCSGVKRAALGMNILSAGTGTLGVTRIMPSSEQPGLR